MSNPVNLADLIRFLETAGQKGWLKPGQADVLRSSCERVLGGLDDGQRLNLEAADIDATIRQFGNLNPDVSPATLRTYASRVRSAIRMFGDMKANPTTWKPPAGRSSANGKTGVTKPPQPSMAGVEGPPVPSQEAGVARAAADFERGLSYPFPLRPDVIVTILNLPRDLMRDEAARLGAFVAALVTEKE